MVDVPRAVEAYDPFASSDSSGTSLPFISVTNPNQVNVQAALDVCWAAGGGTVEVGVGTIALTSRLFIGSKTQLIGSGWNTIFDRDASLVGLPLIRNRGTVATVGTGTASFVQGSQTVLGSGTAFTTQILVGAFIQRTTGGVTYSSRVQYITSNGSLTLDKPWPWASAPAVAFTIINGDRGIRLANFAVNGEKGSDTIYTANMQGIWLTYAFDATIEEVLVDGAKNDGFVLEYSYGSRFERCTANNTLKAGFYLSGSDECSIANCNGRNNGLSAVAVGAGWFNRVIGNTFSANSIYDPSTAGIVVARGSDRNVVVGNTTDGIILDAGQASNIDAPLLFVHPGNQVYIAAQTYGCSGNTVSGNVILASRSCGIKSTLGSANIISNNEISDSSQIGIFLVGSRDNKVFENLIKNSGLGGAGLTAAINLTDDSLGDFSTGNEIDRNRIVDDQGVPTTTGIFVNTGSTKTKVRGNTVGAGSFTILETDVTVSGNIDADGLPLDSGPIFKARSGTERFRAGGVIFVDSTPASTLADTNPTVLLTHTLPANTLAVNGDAIRIRAHGTTAANANTKTIALTVGAASIPVNSATAAPNSKNWFIDFTIIRTGSAAEQRMGLSVMTGGVEFVGSNAAMTEDTTATITITILATNGTAAAEDITYRGMMIEFMPYR